MHLMIYVGTSGFSYPEWKGIFYPAELSSKQYLSFYAERFTTTEINNTFYRSPSQNTTTTWAGQVPEHFRFALKLNQKITHKKRLKDVDEEMSWFLQGAGAMGEKLGVLLVQLPPYFRKDTGVLNDFLQSYSPKARLAVEFRHDSWFSDDVLRLLEEHHSSLAVVESEDRSALRQVTAPFVYVRLRKGAYAEDELSDWAKWLHSLKQEVFVYLKHDEQAPVLAQQLIEKL